MFSLIITLISIALVAALALATLYYGGAIFNDGAERALVSRIEAQAQQLMGALDLYKADTGAYPATLDLLVSSNYLKSLPAALESTQNTLSSAYAATSTWTLAGPYAPVTVLTPVSEATCKAFNKVKYGQAGVLKALRMQLGQCFGTDVNNLMIVTAKSTADLVAVAADPAAAIQLGAVLPDAVPSAASTDASSAGWLLPPATPYSVSYLDSTGAAIKSLNFVGTAVGSTSAPSIVTVKNNGTSSLTFSSTAATVGAPFVIGENTCVSATLAVSATCTVSVSFSPTAEQAYTGASYALSLQSPLATLSSLPLSGTGAAPLTAPYNTAPLVAELNLTFAGSSLDTTWTAKAGGDLSRFGVYEAGYTGWVTANSWDMDVSMGLYGSWTSIYETATGVGSIGLNQVLSKGTSQSNKPRMTSPTEWNGKPGMMVDIAVQGIWGPTQLQTKDFQAINLPFEDGTASNAMTWCVTFDMSATNSGGDPWPSGTAVQGVCP